MDVQVVNDHKEGCMKHVIPSGWSGASGFESLTYFKKFKKTKQGQQQETSVQGTH